MTLEFDILYTKEELEGHGFFKVGEFGNTMVIYSAKDKQNHDRYMLQKHLNDILKLWIKYKA